MPAILLHHQRTAAIKQLSIALVALLEAQDRLGDNTLDDALIAVQERLTYHITKI